MQKVWYPCNVGGFAEYENGNIENIYIFMRRNQRYGWDAIALWMRCHCVMDVPLRYGCDAIALWMWCHCVMDVMPLRYGCDAIALWMWCHCVMDVMPLRYGCVWNALFDLLPTQFYHNTFVVIWNGSECQLWSWENHLKWFWMSVMTLRKPSEMVLNVSYDVEKTIWNGF